MLTEAFYREFETENWQNFWGIWKEKSLQRINKARPIRNIKDFLFNSFALRSNGVNFIGRMLLKNVFSNNFIIFKESVSNLYREERNEIFYSKKISRSSVLQKKGRVKKYHGELCLQGFRKPNYHIIYIRWKRISVYGWFVSHTGFLQLKNLYVTAFLIISFYNRGDYAGVRINRKLNCRGFNIIGIYWCKTNLVYSLFNV